MVSCDLLGIIFCTHLLLIHISNVGFHMVSENGCINALIRSDRKVNDFWGSCLSCIMGEKLENNVRSLALINIY